jgi:cytochrome c biogenesis protein CcmG/thiol:disulfide interchange protein DsbE
MRKLLLTLLAVLGLATLSGLPSCTSLKGSKSAAKEVDKSKLLAVPAVSFKDLQESDVTLAGYKGKVVVVNFWATWCEPCQAEIPWMIEMQQKYSARGFTVLGVAMDDEGKSAVEPFVQKQRFDVNGQQTAMNYPIVLGNDDIAQKFGGLIGLPTTIVVSRDGKIVKRFIGLANRDSLAKEIEGQL